MAGTDGPPPAAFRGPVLAHGKTATGIAVPPEVVEALGGGRRPPVRVTINGGHSYRSTVAVMRGEFMLPISAENRTAAGVAAGDEIAVTLELDTAPREVTVPPDLAAALAADPAAATAFAALSFTNRREHCTAVESAKTAATRERRLAKVLATLHSTPA